MKKSITLFSLTLALGLDAQVYKDPSVIKSTANIAKDFACVGRSDEIRIDQKAGLPVYSQGVSGHCFATASATIFDAYRGPQGTRTPSDVSPIHLASIFKTAPEQGLSVDSKWGKVANNIGGGDGYQLFAKALQARPLPMVCSQKGTDIVWKNFMRTHYGEAFSNQYSPEDFMKYLERVYGSYWYYEVRSDTKNHVKAFQELEYFVSAYFCGNVPTADQPALEKLEEDMKAIMAFDIPNGGQKGLVNFIRTEIDKNCPSEEQITTPAFPVPVTVTNKKDISSLIESQICGVGSPAAINICADGFFFGKPIKGTNGKQIKCVSSCTETEKNNPRTCQSSNHSVTVVGRRVVEKKVEYLIQNSWGKGFCYFPDELKSRCDADGRIWISADRVVDRTASAYAIDQKSPLK